MLVRPLRRRRAAPRGVDLGALLLVLLALLVLPVALAQAPADGERLEGDDVVEGRIEGVPATFSVGLQGGLPGYRYASLVGAMRTDAFGVAARIGYGSVGVSGGVQLRFYPPLPLPIPTYVAAGLDVYTGNTAFHAALGAHVPVGQRVRLDLEGGVARASTLVGTVWAPYASFGVSYGFPLT
nr:hypothetical protein [Trueperaceae bacterium]